MNRRPRIELIAPSASPLQAAAVVAALERFMRDTAPRQVPGGRPRNPWQRMALLEAAGLQESGPTPWGEPDRWG